MGKHHKKKKNYQKSRRVSGEAANLSAHNETSLLSTPLPSTPLLASVLPSAIASIGTVAALAAQDNNATPIFAPTPVCSPDIHLPLGTSSVLLESLSMASFTLDANRNDDTATSSEGNEQHADDDLILALEQASLEEEQRVEETEEKEEERVDERVEDSFILEPSALQDTVPTKKDDNLYWPQRIFRWLW